MIAKQLHINNIEQTINHLSRSLEKTQKHKKIYNKELEALLMLSKMKLSLDEANHYFRKGTNYYYYASLLYKKAFSIIQYFDIYGHKKTLEKYKHTKRKSSSPQFLEKCDSWNFIGSWAVGTKSGKKIVFDITGKRITKYYQDISVSKNHNYITAKKHSGWGLLTIGSNETMGFHYDEIRTDCSGVYAVKENGGWMFMEEKDRTIFPSIKEIKPISSGVIPIRKEKWGFTNREGDILIPCIYDEVGSFKDELCPVKMNCKWGYINRENDLIIPYQFDAASNFNSQSIALVSVGRIEFFINKTAIKVSLNNSILDKSFKK